MVTEKEIQKFLRTREWYDWFDSKRIRNIKGVERNILDFAFEVHEFEGGKGLLLKVARRVKLPDEDLIKVSSIVRAILIKNGWEIKDKYK